MAQYSEKCAVCTSCRGKCCPAVAVSGFVKFLIGAAGLDGLSCFSGSTAVKTESALICMCTAQCSHVYGARWHECVLSLCVCVCGGGGTARCFPTSKDGWEKQKDDREDGHHGAAQVALGNSSRVVQKLCHVKHVA